METGIFFCKHSLIKYHSLEVAFVAKTADILVIIDRSVVAFIITGNRSIYDGCQFPGNSLDLI